MRGYRVPAKPPTPAQVVKRDVFRECCDVWNDFAPAQKNAYNYSEIAKVNLISAYNAMVKSYIEDRERGAAYEEPFSGIVTVKEETTELPLDSIGVYVDKADRKGWGRKIGDTDTNGEVLGQALVAEDQPYDFAFVDEVYKAHNMLYVKSCSALSLFSTFHLKAGSYRDIVTIYC